LPPRSPCERNHKKWWHKHQKMKQLKSFPQGTSRKHAGAYLEMVAAVFLGREEKGVAINCLIGGEIGHRHVAVADAAAAVNALDERAHFLHGRGFLGHVSRFLLRHAVRRVTGGEAQNNGVFLNQEEGWAMNAKRQHVNRERMKPGDSANVQSAKKTFPLCARYMNFRLYCIIWKHV